MFTLWKVVWRVELELAKCIISIRFSVNVLCLICVIIQWKGVLLEFCWKFNSERSKMLIKTKTKQGPLPPTDTPVAKISKWTCPHTVASSWFLLSVMLGWDTCTSLCRDQPCLAITMIYEELCNGEGDGLYIGGAVISSLECVRGWLGLDEGVKSEETLTVSVSPPLQDPWGDMQYVTGMAGGLFDTGGEREQQWRKVKGSCQ